MGGLLAGEVGACGGQRGRCRSSRGGALRRRLAGLARVQSELAGEQHLLPAVPDAVESRLPTVPIRTQVGGRLGEGVVESAGGVRVIRAEVVRV